jgi:spermidine synthase
MRTAPLARLLAALLFCQAASLAAAQELLEQRESQYNSIFVSRSGSYVSMLFGHNKRLYTESRANTGDPLELPVEYTRYMTLPMIYAANPRSLLEIGLGGGSTSSYLHATFPELDISIVELDPVVIDLAEKYFFVKEGERLKIENRDGRIALVRSDKRYDAILIDAYRGPFVPFHLLTKEFFEIVKAHLAEGGVVAQNVEPSTMLYDSAIATIAAVFDHVDVYPASGNFVVLAYDGPPKSGEELGTRAAAIDAKFKPRYPMTGLLARRTPAEESGGQVLTDDFAPVEMLNATEKHNEKMPDGQ